MRVIAFDFETAGFAARYDSSVPVYCIGFAERVDGKVYSSYHDWNTGKKMLADLASKPDVVLLAHNASFDVSVARTHGVDIRPGRYVDSALAAYVLHPGSDVSLDYLGSRYGIQKVDVRQKLIDAGKLSPKAKKGAEFTDINYTQDKEAWDILARYCAVDCEAALVVWEKVSALLKKDPKTTKAYYQLELPYVECIIDMERTGMFIDAPVLDKLRKNLQRRVDCLTQVLHKLVPQVPDLEWNNERQRYEAKSVEYAKGYYKNKANAERYYTDDAGKVRSSQPSLVYPHCLLLPFNPNSTRHVSYALIQQGWKPEEYSDKTGEPKLDAEVIDKLDYPLARVYSTCAEYTKLLGTFIDGISNATDTNGFCHTSFNQATTVTTRLSSSRPNLQNLPSRTALGSRIRDCVVAPEGYTLLVADLDQIEIRVLAFFLEKVCHESRMADGSRAKLDAHQVNADAWGVTRKKAKGGVFAVNYGAMAARLAKTLKVPEEEAQGIIDSINNNMPAIGELKQKVFNSLALERQGVELVDEQGRKRSDGIIYSLFGSRFVLHHYNHHWRSKRSSAERQSFNYLIQGTAANINKELSIRVMPILQHFKGHMSFSVHDEVGVYVPTEHVEKVLELLNKVYDCVDILKHKTNYVPVSGTWNAGATWNIAKEG